eukprot:2599522-Prymnesium_polylepis.1
MPRGSCSDGRLERQKRCPPQPSWAACTVPSRSCRSRSHDRVLCAQMSARLSFPAMGRGRAAVEEHHGDEQQCSGPSRAARAAAPMEERSH